MKKKIILKRKKKQEEKKSNSSSDSTVFFNRYLSTTRTCSPYELPGIVRKIYREVFGETAPMEKYGVQFCKHRVGYHLYMKSLKDEGREIPSSVQKNHDAIMSFNIDKMKNCVIKHSILAELRSNQGGNEMARAKEKKVTPQAQKKASSEKVYETWIRIFDENTKKKLNDEQLANAMQTAHPGKKAYTAADVAKHRSLYNNGKIKSQTKAPKVKVEQVGGTKKAKAVKEKPAAKAKKVKKVKKVAPVAKKKVKLKKKKTK